MKLVLLFRRNCWFIEADEAWYRIEGDEQLQLALSCLSLTILDESSMIKQPHLRGTAELVQKESESVGVKLIEADGEVLAEHKVVLDISILITADWQKRQFQDGWMHAESRIKLGRVKQFSLKLYIPPVEGSDGKDLHIINESTGAQKSVFIKRGQENLIEVIDETVSTENIFLLRCEPEVIANSDDQRQLGFLKLDEIPRVA